MGGSPRFAEARHAAVGPGSDDTVGAMGGSPRFAEARHAAVGPGSDDTVGAMGGSPRFARVAVPVYSTVNTYARTAKGSNVSVMVPSTIGTSCQLIMSRADAGKPGMSLRVNVISIGSLRLLQAKSR